MNWRKACTLAFAILFLFALLPGAGPAQVGASAPPLQADSRVEPQLLAQLDADGTVGYLIYLHQRPDLSPAYQMSWIDRGRFVVKALQETALHSQAPVRAYLDAHGIQYQAFWIDNVLAVDSSTRAVFNGLLDFAEIKALRPRQHPILYEPVETGPLANAPLAVEPNISHVGANQVWALGYTGQGMVVANIDTGVRYTHQALFPHYRGNDGDHNYDWWDPYGDHPTAPADDHGHGSHTMGIMVGDDAAHVNQIGMAPGAQWIACRGCNTNSCTDTALLECAQFVTAPWNLAHANPNPDLRPNVVNNSWGDCDQAYNSWYQGAVDSWQAAGIYPVFSNGNASNCYYPSPPGCNTVGNPARYGSVTGVGSTGQSDGAYATHSNWGPTDNLDTINPNGYPGLKPQVLAPGVNIRSSINSSDTAYYSMGGTSMSAPHVSGLVALIWSACSSMVGDYATTETIIQDTATPIPYASNCGGEGPGNVPNMATGWGEINALAAVQMAVDQCPGIGYLEGTVTGGTPPLPIEGATVTAEGQQGGTWQETTAANGYYIMAMPHGTYAVTVEHPQYTTAVAMGVGVVTDTVTTLDVVLQPKGWLHGYVTDVDSGVPLPATVAASDGTTTATDPSTGYYELLLDAGTHDVTAVAAGYVSQTLSVGVTAGGTTQQDFALLAALTVDPEPIAITLELGQTGEAASVMTNNLAVEYPFQFVELASGLARVQSLEASGGPDPFGYTYIDSNEPRGARYIWIDATDGTALNLGDDQEANLVLPFAFDFYGTVSTALRVGNNGGVLFNATTGDLSVTNQNLSFAPTPNLIVPFWDDLDSAAGNVYYKTVGATPNRLFVVEWYNRPHYSNVGSATFELILYEGSNNIKFQYQDVDFGSVIYDDGASATVGIRQSGSNYLQYSYNSPALAAGMSICFQYPGALPCDAGDLPWYGTSVTGGSLPGGDSLHWTNYFTATPAAGIDQPGEYHAQLAILPGAAGRGSLPSKYVPVVLTVLPSGTMGRLEGFVVGTGYCDADSYPLAAEVVVESGAGDTWLLGSDPATGYYAHWLAPATYTVTASALDHRPVTATVQVSGQQTTTQDLDLRLIAPCMDLAPLTFGPLLAPDSLFTGTLSIANNGAGDLTWEIYETTAAISSMPQRQPLAAVPWVSEVPTAGVTLADSSLAVDVVFDSGGLTAGECYTASLGLVHDDPGWEVPVTIPLRLCVTGPRHYIYLPVIVRSVTP